jgi:hypothetical protein
VWPHSHPSIAAAGTAAFSRQPVEDGDVNVIESGREAPDPINHYDLRVRNHGSERIEIGRILIDSHLNWHLRSDPLRALHSFANSPAN